MAEGGVNFGHSQDLRSRLTILAETDPETAMKTHIFYRYCWQLPLLALFSLSLMPDLPWWHPVVGLWPLWLLAMPVMALARSLMMGRGLVPAAPVSQVLVFPVPRKQSGDASRKAA